MFLKNHIYSHKTFYAIGQGGFYSEVLQYMDKKVVIVYDCGSISPGNRLENEIDNLGFSQIDYLVLSHFDRDHYNKISVLHKKHPIQHIIMPELKEDDQIDILSECIDNRDFASFYFNDFTSIPKIIIEHKEKEHNENDDQPFYFIDNENSEQETRISHHTPIGIFSESYQSSHSSSFPLWVLKFYVDESRYLDDKKNPRLDEDDIKLIKSTKSVSDLKKNKKGLNKAYEKIRSKKNGSSMAMISAPNPFTPPFYFYWHYQDNYVTWMNGDIYLSKEDEITKIIDHYKDFFRFNFDYQLQHHGSHENFFRPVIEARNMNILVYYGYDNKYGHPNGTVLRKIKDAKIPIRELTERDTNFSRTSVWVFD